MFGDDHGAINLLYFHEPLTQLFNAPFNKRQQGALHRIYSQVSERVQPFDQRYANDN